MDGIREDIVTWALEKDELSSQQDEGDGRGWVQWKGTNVCIDIHCPCGKVLHFDGSFFYFCQCPYCEKIFAVGQNVRLHAVPSELEEQALELCFHRLEKEDSCE